MDRALSREGLAARIRSGRPVLLDGALGTELERRSADPRATALPLWSTHALLGDASPIREIHRDYRRAGAEILTANTFRTQRRTLARAGLGNRADELTALAVALAREAATELGTGDGAVDNRPVWVAGSAPPLEDCYHPERVPDDAALAREHAAHARHLVRAGVDAILVETMNCVREAVAALRAARDAGAPVLVSFVCDREARLLSGEPLAEAVDAAAELAPAAIGVNCVPPDAVAACLRVLARSSRPFLVYTNLTGPCAARAEDATPDAFAAAALGWVRAGAACVGGCCGTTPAHLRTLAARLRTSRDVLRAAE
jgi:S-methylmethionine-dependent homocysteine/selenocysteine methylase